MKQSITRSIFRGIHIIVAIPILGYIYSPFDKLPLYAPPTRYVFLPLMLVSGLWMWKGHVLLRVLRGAVSRQLTPSAGTDRSTS